MHVWLVCVSLAVVVVSLLCAILWHSRLRVALSAESLFQQEPDSDMALIWCIEHGVFPLEQAKELYPEYQKAKQRATELNRSRVRKGLAPEAETAAARPKKKPRKSGSNVIMPGAVSAADIGMSIGSGNEHVGVAGL